jgi:hypothetical protein
MDLHIDLMDLSIIFLEITEISSPKSDPYQVDNTKELISGYLTDRINTI